MNRLANCRNEYQRLWLHKPVLCVCSAGLLRSPTMAWVLSQEPYNYNTRAAGITDDFALVPVDEVLVKWAEEIVFAERAVFDTCNIKFNIENKDITVLTLPDKFEYRNEELVKAIKEQYAEATT